MNKKFLLLCSVFLISLTCSSHNSIILSPVQDNTLYQDSSGALSSGAGTGFFTGTTNENEIRRAVIKFDIAAALPANAVITEVSLVLTVNQTISGAAMTHLYFLNNGWGEGTSVGSGAGAYAQANDATWIHRYYPSVFWNSPGGDFVSTASASLSVNGTGSYTWSSAQMVSDVQAWLNSPSANSGWIIIGDESTYPTAKRFASKENTNTSSRPKLIIEYYIGCHNPDVPVITASGTNVCANSEVIINTSGDLHDAETWMLYSGSCGSGFIDSSATGVFTINPSSSSTYYIRGEGGCITPGSCASVTINVNEADDAAFHFNSVIFCRNEVDPVPVITGTADGIFSSSPGLQINPETGEIDLSASSPGNYSVEYLTSGSCSDTSHAVITILPDFSIDEYRIICLGEEFEFGSQTIFEDGVYSEYFNTINGCDSVVTLHLSTVIFQNEISQDGNFITVSDEAENYQWISCTDYSPVPGANSSTFEGEINNSYAVVLMEGSCVDTSGCYTLLSVEKYNNGTVRLFPNPSNGEIIIETNDLQNTVVEIYDLSGKKTEFSSSLSGDSILIRISDPCSSVYLVKIKSGENLYIEKLLIR